MVGITQISPQLVKTLTQGASRWVANLFHRKSVEKHQTHKRVRVHWGGHKTSDTKRM